MLGEKDFDYKCNLIFVDNSLKIYHIRQVTMKISKQAQDSKKTYEIAGTKFVVDAKYEINKQIGSGAYGVVVSAIDKTTNKKYIAKSYSSYRIKCFLHN